MKASLLYWRIFVSVVALAALRCQAQEPTFTNLSVENGLPSSEVYCVLQDAKGYVWFATDYGVCRYDGNKFINYTTQQGLIENTVLLMTRDYKDRIWLYSFSGRLSCIDQDTIFTIPDDGTLSDKLRGLKISSIYIDKNDTIWMGFRNGGSICKINPDFTYRFIKNPDSIHTWVKYIDPSHAIWSRASLHYDLENIQFQTPKSKFVIPLGKTAKFSEVYRYLHWNDGSYLLAINNTIYYGDKSGILSTRTFNSVIFHLSKEDSSVWVGMKDSGAVKILNKANLNTNAGPYLAGKSVSYVMKDREGSYWFSTLQSGVYYTPSMNFLAYNKSNSPLTDEKINFIVVRKQGELIVSQNNNKLCFIKEKKIYPLNIPEKKIISPQINKAMYVDRNDNVWVAYDRVICIDGKMPLTVTPSYKPFHAIYNYTFYHYKDGTIWAGNGFGVGKMEADSINFHQIYRFRSNPPGTQTLRVETICELNDTMYLGGLSGVWMYKDYLYTDLAPKYPAFKTRVLDIKKDLHGRIWLATRGNGVLVKQGGIIKSITTKEGLVSDFCTHIYIDTLDNYTWVCTNKGISIIKSFDFKNKRFEILNITRAVGITSEQINAMCRQGDNIWLATDRGITFFDIRRLTTNNISPPIYISKIFVNNNKLRGRPDSLTLTYDKNNILIEYEGVSFKNAGKIPYRYKLENVHQDWIYTYNTAVDYPDLPPGNYIFKVEAANIFGMWSMKAAKLKITVKAAFYQTIWFIILCVILGVAFTWSIFYTYYNRVRRSESMQQKVLESEQKALRSQMNPHFIFNSLNSIQRFIMKNDKLSSSTYLSKFSNLMRSILENSQNSYITLSAELHSLQLYLELEALRFENKFDFIIDLDPEIDAEHTQIPGMLLQPYLENAIKHGLSNEKVKGNIELIIKKSPAGITCIIEDDGIGRKKAEEKKASNHKSFGQKISQDRIDVLNLGRKNKITLTIVDLYNGAEASGTRVVIEIPNLI